MRIKINQPEAFAALVKKARGARKRSDRNRVIASKNDRKFIRLKDFINTGCQLPASSVNLGQVFQFLVETGKRSGSLRMQITEVIDVIPDGRDSLREPGDAQRIAAIGYDVNDLGDLHSQRSTSLPGFDEKLKHLTEIYGACRQLATSVYEVFQANEFPIILGGDHSIAIGSFSGAARFFHERGESLGLIYFDAHADMNTPETTPSGNIHGMPLSALLGHGAPQLTEVAGFSPKLDPKF